MKLFTSAPLTESEEQALVRRLPDEAAREELVLRTMPSGIRYTSKICRGSKPEEELVSLVYSALTKAVRNLHPEKGRFMPYAKIYLRSAVFYSWKDSRTIRNVENKDMLDFEAYQKLKEKKDRRSNELDIPEELDTAGHPAEEFDFDSMHIRETFGRAAEAMKRLLTDHEKVVIQLRFTLDYSFEQIAKFLEITRSAAQSSCERALRKLRAEMGSSDTLR
jgi:RNA polymerase sigma factor (sigma-70 family)